MTTLAEKISLLFEVRNYKWRIGGELRHPTANDIEKVLREAKAALDNESGTEVSLEIGRLIVRKEAGHYDVYVHFGELDE